MSIFFSGFSAAVFCACGLFFLKFWVASKDRFFLVFCGAFWLLTLERLLGVWLYSAHNYDQEYVSGIRNWLYLIRLPAFTLILFGIIEKNRARR